MPIILEKFSNINYTKERNDGFVNKGSEGIDFDSQLNLTLLQISGIKVEKELRINVHLDRVYSIFVD